MKILTTDLISPRNLNLRISGKKKNPYKIHITVKMINIQVKGKILRASREERDYNQSGMETVSEPLTQRESQMH